MTTAHLGRPSLAACVTHARELGDLGLRCDDAVSRLERAISNLAETVGVQQRTLESRRSLPSRSTALVPASASGARR